MMGLIGHPNCVPNLKSILSAIAYILKGKPQIFGSSPDPGPCPLFLVGGILMGLSKSYQSANFEVAIFSHYRNIKGEPQNFRELP